ncbi:CheR family methyltransferase [Uliginosibacterium sp. H1]|uniref:CheR family methyltransferase n=1 Tax=Uliginosibacterium sp. H1 TaxID=3114757 RepID=UPI002E17CF64|nr:CheR family methyltransferase [Uliginosibacterium sp. H1]
MLDTTQALSPSAYRQLCTLFKQASGIHLPVNKQTLIASRLRTRLEHLGLPDFDAYCSYVQNRHHGDEHQRMVDLLTTNETYFFREPAHFALLKQLIKGPLANGSLRVWSAACSSGEEAYSIAMTLADEREDPKWDIVASDISSRALTRARRALYPLQRIENMPHGYLQRYCLRGKGDYAGNFLIERNLRARVQCMQHNLTHDGAAMGMFDVIFLRNALIYFEPDAKMQILERMCERLRPGAYLFVGHAEALHTHDLPLQRVGKAAYRRLA